MKALWEMGAGPPKPTCSGRLQADPSRQNKRALVVSGSNASKREGNWCAVSIQFEFALMDLCKWHASDFGSDSSAAGTWRRR
jgi:hypothetical protein